MTLDYESEGFAVRARNLISAGQTVSIVVRGRSRDLLREHLVDGRIGDCGAMTRSLELGMIVALVCLAEGRGRSHMFEESSETIILRIGVGVA